MMVNEVGCFTSTRRTSFGSVPETPSIKEENQEKTITSNCSTVLMPRSTVGTGAFLLVNNFQAVTVRYLPVGTRSGSDNRQLQN